jgi:2-keto-4-pentenoate hydratase
MTPDAARAAARILHRARVDRRALAALPPDCAPASVDDGYAIQEAWAEAVGWPLVGYKIGCTSADAQAMLGADGPFPGRVFAPFLHDSPAALAAGDWIRPAVEGEFAFRLGADLPARAAPYTRAEVEDAVAAAHPAIEIVDTRFADFTGIGVPGLIADSGANGGLVLGAPVADWRGLDLAAVAVTMSTDGIEKARGTGAEALGHPLAALTWLANDLSRRGFGLLAGQVVSTGTCTGIFPLTPGATARARHAGLGTVEVTLAA